MSARITGERQVIYKKIQTAVPQGLLDEMDEIARREHRTRMDLMREAFRRYVTTARVRLSMGTEVITK